jgi:hypothetical protein
LYVFIGRRGVRGAHDSAIVVGMVLVDGDFRALGLDDEKAAVLGEWLQE